MKLQIVVLFVVVSLMHAADFSILGQFSITDWSLNPIQSLPFTIDFEEERSSFSCVLQWTHRFLDTGLELDVIRLTTLKWTDLDGTSYKTRNLSEYGGSLFVAVRFNRNCFSPYLKLVPGFYRQSMRYMNSTSGFPPVNGFASTPLHFSFGILA